MLEIRLIGKFDICFNGEPIALTTRASQSLLAYLILTTGTPHRREKLAGMFWPDAAEKTARTYLRQELWRIRKAIAARTAIEYLSANELSISFNNLDTYWLDVNELKRLPDWPSVQELMDGLSVYTGELLPGFYEEWITLEREHLQSLYEKRMGQLLDLLGREKRWQEMRDWAENWLASSPASERTYQGLMLAYKSLGEPHHVISTYERCVNALKDLGLEPSEQTRALLVKRSPKINLPIPLTSFIGRETELKEVAGLLRKSRLVTLTGSGGVGKTRLAIQVVAEVLDLFPDGVWFLDLAPLSDPKLIPNTLMSLLNLHESVEVPLIQLLVNYFQPRKALVVFDNCEHLIDSCADLAHTLLSSCEHLSILATSREHLRVAGEISYRVPSLETPNLTSSSNVSDLLKIESIILFTDRAANALFGFEINSQNAVTIAQICQRLDGVPLAIELAAARMKGLSVDQIASRLNDRFHLLTGGSRTALPRHQTLQATFDWSFDGLSDDEQILLRRLSVFAGGWTLEAAEQVCQDQKLPLAKILEQLLHLVDKSLVVAQLCKGDTRYHMLESIRQYAQEKLEEAGESGALRDRHLDYFCSLAEQAHPHLKSSQQILWLERLELEHDNIRFALDWAQHGGDVSKGLRLATELKLFWMFREYFRESSTILEALLALFQPDEQIQLLARSHRAAGWMHYFAGNRTRSLAHIQMSESFLLRIEPIDKIGLADTRTLLSELMLYVEHDPVQLRQILDENFKVYQDAGERHDMARTLGRLSTLLHQVGDLENARQVCEQSVALFYACGDQIRATQESTSLAVLAIEEGRYADAREQMERAAVFYEKIPVNFAASVPLWLLGAIALREQDYERAKIFYT